MDRQETTDGDVITVVLLHGLGRTPRSMRPVAECLTQRGYRISNIGYPSRSATVRSLAESVAHEVCAIATDAPMHFVTHSLGGILLRLAVADGLIPLHRIGRVVMLGPPNGGSHLADALTRWRTLGWFYRLATGPAGLELGVEGDSAVSTLPPLPFETGIIAGSRSVNPLLSLFLPRPNDGKVSVAQAAAPGMRAFLVVPHSHPFLMRAEVVLAQTVAFLAAGSFLQNVDSRHSGART